MNAEYFTEWQRRQGHDVLKTKSSYWYNIGPKVYQAFPYQKLIKPSNDEIINFFKQSKAIAIRYSTPLNQSEGQLSYHVIYDRNNYELSGLHPKARNHVNAGLKYASYEPIPLVRLAKEGWSLREETLIRQGRKNAELRSIWETLCLSADGLPCFEAWGALHEGNLVSALFACTIEDTVNILYQQSLTQHLKFGINNALTYIFTRDVLNRPGIRCIFYGLHSLDAPPSVDDYKFRMRYSAKPVRQRVVFNPFIAPLIQPLSHSLIKALKKILPASPQIAKAEGMVRFYLQGKHPISDQEWPDVLQDQREKILALLR
jgi:hypothetical protein